MKKIARLSFFLIINYYLYESIDVKQFVIYMHQFIQKRLHACMTIPNIFDLQIFLSTPALKFINT